MQIRPFERRRATVSPMRSFDPRAVGELECRAWVTYYRHEWFAFLLAAVRLVRETFALPWPATLLGAWWVLRANQVWAPYPDNRPDLAQRIMRRFYALVARAALVPSYAGLLAVVHRV